ncbi:MAG TPA: hypothetical protein VJK07_04255 [Candidatus Nanoarchaeia archaeon]|nr:hypothetical protein [Candidatus Nanoarchaeia archaeon]
MNKKLVFLLIALILLVLSISFFKRNTDNSIKLPDNESINVSSHVCLVGYLWLNLDGDERCYKECPNGMRDCVNSTDSTCALVTPYENPQQTEQVCSSPAMDTILNK